MRIAAATCLALSLGVDCMAQVPGKTPTVTSPAELARPEAWDDIAVTVVAASRSKAQVITAKSVFLRLPEIGTNLRVVRDPATDHTYVVVPGYFYVISNDEMWACMPV